MHYNTYMVLYFIQLTYVKTDLNNMAILAYILLFALKLRIGLYSTLLYLCKYPSFSGTMVKHVRLKHNEADK